MTLAEILKEGEALVAKGHASFFSHDAGAARALDLLPRLLAVAKAGRTLAAAVAGTGSCTEELAAFDAAVRGEGQETTNG